MGEDRLAAGLVDPAERLGHRRPFVLDVARHCRVTRKRLKHVLGLARVAGLDEEAREMRAADQSLAGHVFHRAFVGIRDAGGRQRIARCGGRDASGPRESTPSPREQRRAFGIDAAAPRRAAVTSRQLTDSSRAGDKAHACAFCGGARLGETADFVVIGQRPHVDAALRRALRDGSGRQQAVGVGRMAVQIVAKHSCAAARRASANDARLDCKRIF